MPHILFTCIIFAPNVAGAFYQSKFSLPVSMFSTVSKGLVCDGLFFLK